MTMLLHVSLVFLILAAQVHSNHKVVGKYGCVFTPNACIPPEDCDGFTGHCQLSRRYTDSGSVDADRDALKILEAVRSHDYTNPDSSSLDMGLLVNADSDSPSLVKPKRSYSGQAKQLKQYLDNSNYEMKEKKQDTGYETGQLINKHLDEIQYALAQRGKKLADLTSDQLEILVRYLAGVIKNEQSGNFRNPYKHDLTGQGSEIDIKTKDINDPILVQHSPNEENIESSPVPVILKSSDYDDASDAGTETIEVADNNHADGVGMEVAEPSNTYSVDITSNPTSQSKLQKDALYIVIAVVGATVFLIIVVTIASCAYYTYKKKKQKDIKFMQSMTSREPVGSEYQDLCRQHYANKNYEGDDESDSDGNIKPYPFSSRKLTEEERSKAAQTSSVSSMSWSEEPATASLDIATGHKVLDYMENHHNNKNRLAQEWHDLSKSTLDEFPVEAAKLQQNISKNRVDAALPYDYNRVKLDATENHVESDYINASKIIDSDPNRPLYIAAQGPLLSTVPDFWQMVWEYDCVAIVMLTPLVEEGVNQCARYWPDEGSSRYHNIEIKLVSEHIWCEHYLVRSLYMKHMVSGETRTVTQFHFLSWPKDGVPSTPKHLLELRRKVSKCSTAHHSPVLVHCSDGVGRTGTYILLDLAISRLLKRPLEIDIAATLEHLRDMRAGMVANKDQFEFALTAVAEEVNTVVKTPF